MNTKIILLIDDDKDFLAAQNVLLEHSGYKIYEAYSGEEGYIKAQEVSPDLIILDVNMETTNAGFDLNRKLRKDPKLATTPIIMLTGIETYQVSSQILEMYTAMISKDDPNYSKVLKTGNASGDIGVQYIDDNGNPFYLPLDCFVPKINSETLLLKEIKRLIG